MESLNLAKKIAHLAADKKAENIVVLDMRGIVNYCDYFVICSGTSSRHAKAIADGIDDGLSELGVKVKFKQGLGSFDRQRIFSLADAEEGGSDERLGQWGLLDMGDVVVHIFEADSRDFYGLEFLWQGAARIDWER